MPENKNKKHLLLCAVIAVMICLTACGDPSGQDNIVPPQSSADVALENTAAPNEAGGNCNAEQESAELIFKDCADWEDLIKDDTFYACVPKNRYGGSSGEGDYAEGKFLLWLNRLTLSDSGEIIGRDSLIVPYIVSDGGNRENLSMLSGGRDGEAPYGDSILEITTDINGEITDAVFINQP